MADTFSEIAMVNGIIGKISNAKTEKEIGEIMNLNAGHLVAISQESQARVGDALNKRKTELGVK